MEQIEIVEYIVKTLVERGLTLSAAESCTGGMLSSAIVDYPGASSVFMDGIVSYSNTAKMKFLGVKADTLDKFGAVSPETAAEMCQGVAAVSGTNIGLSTTGVAGPGGGTPEKPVGLVYTGIYINGSTHIAKLRLDGDRTSVRRRTTMLLLTQLKELLEKGE